MTGNLEGKCRRPCVSIIIATYNAERYIADCLHSIAVQRMRDIETIVIDGASTDGTCRVLAEQKSVVDYWISEPDRGIYDAMNKGLDLAQGEWILFLGADDRLHDAETLQSALAAAEDWDDLIAGRIMYDNGRVFNPVFDWRMLIKNCLHHQGTLYRRHLFDHFRYCPEFRISGDYELNLKLFLEQAHCRLVDTVIADCRAMGISHQTIWQGYGEEIQIRTRHLPHHGLRVVLNMATFLRYHVKKSLLRR